jgi:methylated-DNA-protein-cysteine methyltransferase related protein
MTRATPGRRSCGRAKYDRRVADSDGFAQRILDCIEQIPPGKVMTYGDVAEFAGTRSARTVGRVLAHDGGTVPWHRVLRADGSLAEHLYTEQRQRLLAEGVRFRGDRVDLARFRWDGSAR